MVRVSVIIIVVIITTPYAVRGPNIIQITPIWDISNSTSTSKELAWDVYVDEEVYFHIFYITSVVIKY